MHGWWCPWPGSRLIRVLECRERVGCCTSAGGGSPSLRFGFAIHPPLERSWFAARVTPLPNFRENLMALGAPCFNVVVRCVVEIDHRAKKNLFAKGAPGGDP